MLVDLAERLGDRQQLLFQQQKNLPLDGVGRNDVVDLGSVALTVAVDSPDPLLDIHRVPRQIMVEQHAGKLKIDSFSSSRGADQHARSFCLSKSLLGGDFGALVAALEHLDPLPGNAARLRPGAYRAASHLLRACSSTEGEAALTV